MACSVHHGLLLDVGEAESSGEDHHVPTDDGQRGTRDVKVHTVAINLRRQAVKSLLERGNRPRRSARLRGHPRGRVENQCREQQQEGGSCDPSLPGDARRAGAT